MFRFYLFGRIPSRWIGIEKKGLNRIGNLLVPNDNYCKFEDWVMPILDEMRKEWKEKGDDPEEVWTPSKIIARLGKEINDEVVSFIGLGKLCRLYQYRSRIRCSDSGARPDEAVSWGKIKSKERGGENVKVYCDATIIFPLIVAAT
ncbi:hypothetical protein L7F22_037818 [Adiantum nelumboides]|nr:hypothetical protein [Adiantum nelumboides]